MKHHRVKVVSAGLVAFAALAVVIAATSGTHGGHTTVRVVPASNGSDRTQLSAPITVAPADEALFPGPEPDAAQQAAILEGWYGHEVADAPNGRPVLDAEVTFCDYRAVDPSLQSVDFVFSSAGALETALTNNALVDGCLSSLPKIGSADGGSSSPLSGQEEALRTNSEVCSAALRGPIFDPAAARSDEVVTKPVAVFGRACTDASYSALNAEDLATLQARRALEIKLRAIPRECPSQDEAFAWIRKVTTEAGHPLTPKPGPIMGSAPQCYFHMYVDWDTSFVYVA